MSEIYRAHISGREAVSGAAPVETTGVAQGETPPARTMLDAGVTYTDVAGGEVRREDRSAALNVADLKSTAPGILATAENPWGGPARQLNSKTVVTLPGGIKTSLAAAEKQGYVTRGPDGQWREVEQTDAPQEDATEGDNKPQPFADQQAERLLDESVRLVPPYLQDNLVHRILTDSLDERTLHDTAAASNMTVDELKGRLTTVYTAFTAQAAAVAAEAGINDFRAWSEWARKNHPDELREARQAHVYARNPRAYESLFARYFRETLPSAAALEAAGYKVRRGPRGTELVTIDGVEMSIKTAAREGLL